MSTGGGKDVATLIRGGRKEGVSKEQELEILFGLLPEEYRSLDSLREYGKKWMRNYSKEKTLPLEGLTAEIPVMAV